MADRNALLKNISETSFILDDLCLYLDNHPLDKDAMNLYQQHLKERRQLLKQYADEFEPLTTDCICLESNGSPSSVTKYPNEKHWTWSDGPVPWEVSANNFATMKGGV